MNPKIQHIVGDIFQHLGNFLTQGSQKEKIVILQVVNDLGKYGRGFSGEISKRFPEVESQYRKWASQENSILGEIQIVEIQPNVFVVNMACQKGLKSDTSPVPLDYVFLLSCLIRVNSNPFFVNSHIHCPKIGCNNAGGNWNMVSVILQSNLTKMASITVYELPL